MVLKKNKDGTFSSHVERKKNIIPLRLNDEEYKYIDAAREILEQPKISTTIKQLALIGYLYISQPETQKLLKIIYDNKRKNKRIGIIEFEL